MKTQKITLYRGQLTKRMMKKPETFDYNVLSHTMCISGFETEKDKTLRIAQALKQQVNKGYNTYFIEGVANKYYATNKVTTGRIIHFLDNLKSYKQLNEIDSFYGDYISHPVSIIEAAKGYIQDFKDRRF